MKMFNVEGRCPVILEPLHGDRTCGNDDSENGWLEILLLFFIFYSSFFYIVFVTKRGFMLEREEVLKLAKLSRLEVAESDIESVKGHLDKMLNHLEALKALDLSDVEPMTAVENGATILREDVPVQGFSLEKAFMNAPAVENDHFAIPKVIGG